MMMIMMMMAVEVRAAAVATRLPATQTCTSLHRSLPGQSRVDQSRVEHRGSIKCKAIITQLGTPHGEAWRWRSAGSPWPCWLPT